MKKVYILNHCGKCRMQKNFAIRCRILFVRAPTYLAAKTDAEYEAKNAIL